MHFVFMQGGYSTFFNRVADGLQALGHRVSGFTFCAGDSWLWRAKETIHYRGRLQDWPDYFNAWLDRHTVTDLVLLGEQRDYHKQAVSLAQQRGIRVSVTDFGYLRPDWITLERDGMGGNSHFPRDPQRVRHLAQDLPPVDWEVRFRDRLVDMATGDLVYSFANVLLWFLYPHYRRSDHRAHPLKYFPALGWRLLWASKRGREAGRDFTALRQQGSEYFLLPMQLDHDFQIQAYSTFDDMGQVLQQVFASFAGHAPESAHLLIKLHPWDPGFRDWRGFVEEQAAVFGLKQRVWFLDGGSLEAMVCNARGMVVVNSTSAISALQMGCPLICLGQAIFDTPGLSFQQGLDKFWTEASPPEADLVEDFLRLLANTSQFKGVFYSEPGLTVAVQTAVNRLVEAKELYPE